MTIYPASGIRDSFHILSHHSNIEANKDRFAVLNRYHVGLFAYLLEKLDASPDGDGSLLDHSHGALRQRHERRQRAQPRSAARRARRAAQAARSRAGATCAIRADTTMSNLLLAMLHKLGIERDSFGDSTGMLSI